MDEAYLKRQLTSVGRRVFVEYFKEFANEALSNQEVADVLPYEYTLKSRLSRTSHARSIIRQGLTADALTMISESEAVDAPTRDAARTLLADV